jgi:hypothetical protein
MPILRMRGQRITEARGKQRLSAFLNPVAVSLAIAVLDLYASSGVCANWRDGFDGGNGAFIE